MLAQTHTRAEKDPQLGGLSSTASTGGGGGGGEKGKGLWGEFGKLSCCCYGPFDSVAMVIITAHKDHPSMWQAACFWLLVHSYFAQATVGHTGDHRDRL